MAQVNLYLVTIGTLFFLFGSHLEYMNNKAYGITFNKRRYIPYETTFPEFVGRIFEIIGAILMSHAGTNF